MRKRDIQKQKVYDWEDSQSWMIKKSYLTQDECHAVIKRLNKIFRRSVKLRFKNGHGSCWSINMKEILLRNEWGRSYGVLLHEFAHCLTNDKHNGSFVSNYCLLLHYLHPEQPSIKDLVKSMNKVNIDFKEFEKTLAKKVLSKRYKPFKAVSTEPLPVAVSNVRKRVSAKQRVMKTLDEWKKFYYLSEYEYSTSKFVYINGLEHGDILDTWKEVEVCLLDAIEQKLHLHKDYLSEVVV